MSRKAIGKTVARTSRSDAKGGGLLTQKKFRFLESVRFTNLTTIAKLTASRGWRMLPFEPYISPLLHPGYRTRSQ